MRAQIIKSNSHKVSLIKVLGFLGTLVSLFCIFSPEFNGEIKNLWLLPTTYSIGLVLLGKKNVIDLSPGILTLNLIMFCRYAVLPFAMTVSSRSFSKFAIQYGHTDDAIFLMLIELICVLLAIYISSTRFANKVQNGHYINVTSASVELGFGIVIAIACIGLVVVMVINYPHLLGGIELLTKGRLSNEIDIEGVSGAVGILWKSLTSFLGVFIIFYIKKIKFNSKLLTPLLVGLILLFVLISFVGQVSITRWYSLVTFCAMYFTTIKLFPEKQRGVTIWVAIPMIMFLLLTSLYKNTNYIEQDMGILGSIKELFDVTVLDSYFAGPVSVNNAIYLKEKSSANFFAIFYDALRNFPILNHYIDVKKSTVGMYAMYMDRKDLILPLVGQSMMYFGYIFSPILSITSVFLVRFFDYQYLKSSSLGAYVFAFVSCWIGLITILNFTICVSWFYSVIIPLFLLIKVAEMTGIRQVSKELMMEER